MLSEINQHPRDKLITFDSTHHKYTVKGDPEFVSVTTFLKKFFAKFDPVSVATNMVKRSDFKTNPKYSQYQFELSQEELIKKIVQTWTDYGKSVSEEGTSMHAKIEQYYNDPTFDHGNELFRIYDNMMKGKGYLPYRTEWMIFDEDYKIAGCVDMLYYHPEGKTYHLVDWKRSKKIEFKGFKKALPPIDHLEDCNGVQYSLQLNLYKHIIEKNYGIKITDMKLVILHPNCSGIIEVPELGHEIKKML